MGLQHQADSAICGNQQEYDSLPMTQSRFSCHGERFLQPKSYPQGRYVPHSLDMPRGGTAVAVIVRSLYGTHLLDHLAADGAGFPGSQIAVVAVLQVHTDLP